MQLMTDSPKRFKFTVTLVGYGDTEAEAWNDAVNAFCDDPVEAESCLEIDEDGDPI